MPSSGAATAKPRRPSRAEAEVTPGTGHRYRDDRITMPLVWSFVAFTDSPCLSSASGEYRPKNAAGNERLLGH